MSTINKNSCYNILCVSCVDNTCNKLDGGASCATHQAFEQVEPSATAQIRLDAVLDLYESIFSVLNKQATESRTYTMAEILKILTEIISKDFVV